MKPEHDSASDGAGQTLRLGCLQWQLTLKELRETLRDRRTIVTLLAMPVLLYPLLGLGFRFVALQQHSTDEPVYRLAVATEGEASWLNDALAAGQRLLGERGLDGTRTAPAPKYSLLVPEDPASFDLRRSVAGREVDLGLRVEHAAGDAPPATPAAQVEIVQLEGSGLSRDAADFVLERLRRLNLVTVAHWARSRDERFRLPIVDDVLTVELLESTSPIVGLLPLVLLLMTVTGGVYPAIDLTAGERERDTLETLMALPVPRVRILLAKYVAVFSVTMLTGVMNLSATFLTVWSLQLERTLFGTAGLTVALGLQLVLVLTAFALFYSAVLLWLTGSARSFKEAQAYLIPLLLLSLTPGLLILMPGWTLNRGTAIVPLLNLLLLARHVFEGEVQAVPAVIAVACTLCYTVVALLLAARMFGADATAVGSRGSWSDLLRRPTSASGAATVETALIVLAGIFAAYFVATGLLGRVGGSAGQYLLLSAGLTVMLFAAFPVAALWWQRVRPAQGLRLAPAKLSACLGASLVGVAAWPWAFELALTLRSFGIGRIDQSTLQSVEQLLAQWKAMPLVLIVVALAVIPGVCEEIFFRGFLFSAIRTRCGGRVSVVSTAVAFGLFHVVLAGGVAAERFVPSTLMGLLLGWVSWRTGSILPSMLLHAMHNSFLLLMVRHIEIWPGAGHSHAGHLPAGWLVSSALAVVVGLLAVGLPPHGPPPRQPPEDSPRSN